MERLVSTTIVVVADIGFRLVIHVVVVDLVVSVHRHIVSVDNSTADVEVIVGKCHPHWLGRTVSLVSTSGCLNTSGWPGTSGWLGTSGCLGSSGWLATSGSLRTSSGCLGRGLFSVAYDDLCRRTRLERQKGGGWNKLVEDTLITEARHPDDGLDNADEDGEDQQTDDGVQYVKTDRAVEWNVVERGVGEHDSRE